jgi:hypothetical protein
MKHRGVTIMKRSTNPTERVHTSPKGESKVESSVPVTQIGPKCGYTSSAHALPKKKSRLESSDCVAATIAEMLVVIMVEMKKKRTAMYPFLDKRHCAISRYSTRSWRRLLVLKCVITSQIMHVEQKVQMLPRITRKSAKTQPPC